MFNLINDKELDNYAAKLADFEGLPVGFNLGEIEDHQETLASALTYSYLTYKLRSFLENQTETPYFEKVGIDTPNLPRWAQIALGEGKSLYAFQASLIPKEMEADLKCVSEYLKEMSRQYLWATAELARRTKHPAKVRPNYLKEDGRFQDFNATVSRAKEWQHSQEKAFKEGVQQGTHRLTTQDGLQIVSLTTKEALQEEGKQMHNCIGKLHIKPVLSGKEKIYSMRNENGKSLISASIKDGKVSEIKRSFNKPLEYSKEDLFMLTWLLSQGLGVSYDIFKKMGYVIYNGKLFRLQDLPKDRPITVEGDIVVEGELGALPDLSNVHCLGNFVCSNCHLTSLKGAPKIVDGDFVCSHNELTSLKWLPVRIGGRLNCSNNHLTSLVGSPEHIRGNFDCSENALKTLEGAPKQVDGNFDCSNNSLIGLKGMPTVYGKRINCAHNQLSNFDGVPAQLDYLNMTGNHFSHLHGVPKVKTLLASENPLESLEGLQDGLEDLSLTGCHLRSLVGLPRRLKNLTIDDNNLTSFIGLPEEIDFFSAVNNPLKSLEGLPKIIHTGCNVYDWENRKELMDKVVQAGGKFISEFEISGQTIIDIKPEHIACAKKTCHTDQIEAKAQLDEIIIRFEQLKILSRKEEPIIPVVYQEHLQLR